VRRARPGDSRWTNLRATWRRMKSRPVGGARVRVRFLGAEAEAEADAEGHVQAYLLPEHRPDEGEPWAPADLELLDPAGRALGVRSVCPVLVPSRGAGYGVVSDVDDTVVQADVARLARMVADVVFGNAHTRMPFPGVASFFRALHRGLGTAPNPVFYVSNGPWNLYDAFVHFLELHDIPLGPVELRDWGPLRRELLSRPGPVHKKDAIRRIFETLPDLPFLLIGDSGEEDPEIYRDLVQEYPRRVLAVYIRDVSGDLLRRRRIVDLAEEVDAAGSALVLADDTVAAARHAADHGWIRPEALDVIAEETAVDARWRFRRPRSIVVEGGETRERR